MASFQHLFSHNQPPSLAEEFLVRTHLTEVTEQLLTLDDRILLTQKNRHDLEDQLNLAILERDSIVMDSLQHMFSRKERPSRVGKSLGRSRYTELTQQLRTVSDKITFIKTEQDDLGNQRSQVIRERDAIAGVLSPLRRFPVELISEICSTTSSITPLHRVSSQTLLLSRVSQNWRCSVLSTPTLLAQCSIRLEDCLRDTERRNTVIAGATAWCRRSAGALPVTLITTYTSKSFEPESLIVPALDLLIKATGSTHLILNIPCALLSYWTISRISKTQDVLQSLTLIDVEWGTSWSTRYKSAPMSDPRNSSLLPNLTEFAVKSKSKISFNSEPSIPWNQLTKLRLTTNNGYMAYLNILRECVSLEICTLCLATKSPRLRFIPQPQSEIVLSRLHTFRIDVKRISVNGLASFADFLEPLRLPVLRDLTIGGGGCRKIKQTETVISLVVNFIHKSDPSVNQITIDNLCTFNAQQAKEMSTRLPPTISVRIYQDGEVTRLDSIWRNSTAGLM